MRWVVKREGECDMIKKYIKRVILKHRSVDVSMTSNINLNFAQENRHGVKSIIWNSNIHVDKMGEGCFIENINAYGNIELGRFVSISGPGTILHAVKNKIYIGSFSSIAQNVSIQEFNHNINCATTFAIQRNLYHKPFQKDVISKGNIVLEEDVWIGSNAVILSGVRIGRGSIIGAGSIITKSIPRYSIVVGNPGKRVKQRFDNEICNLLEELQWWKWPTDKILQSRDFFQIPLNQPEIAIKELKKYC